MIWTIELEVVYTADSSSIQVILTLAIELEAVSTFIKKRHWRS